MIIDQKYYKSLAGSSLGSNAVRILIYLISVADNTGYINERMSLEIMSSHCRIAYTTSSRAVAELKKANIVDMTIDVGIETHYSVKPPKVWDIR